MVKWVVSCRFVIVECEGLGSSVLMGCVDRGCVDRGCVERVFDMAG